MAYLDSQLNKICNLYRVGKKSYKETNKIYSEMLNITKDSGILDRLITGRTYYRYD